MVMMLAFVVLSGSFYLAAQTFQNSNAVESAATTTDNVQRGIDQFAHDVEHATAATVTGTSAVLTVPATTPGAAAVTPTPTTTVTWSCTAGASCTRRVASGTAVPVIAGVVSATLSPTFASGAPATQPSYIGLQLQARVVSELRPGGASPKGATGTLSFSDGAALRNFAR